MNTLNPNTTPQTNPQNWLTTMQAARLLKCAPGTLANKRVRGEGPPFIKYGGSVFYAKSIIEQHLAQKACLYHSTSEWKNTISN